MYTQDCDTYEMRSGWLRSPTPMGLLLKTSWMARILARLSLLVDGGDRGVDRPAAERFAIPYTFKPRLGFIQALVGIAGAFLRIFLGSLLFAIWGTYSLVAWSVVRSGFWRVTVVVLLLLLFLLALAALMFAISSLARRFSDERP